MARRRKKWEADADAAAEEREAAADAAAVCGWGRWRGGEGGGARNASALPSGEVAVALGVPTLWSWSLSDRSAWFCARSSRFSARAVLSRARPFRC